MAGMGKKKEERGNKGGGAGDHFYPELDE